MSGIDYGNEKESGAGLKKAIDDGIVKREEVFVTSKLWNTFHAKEHVLPIVKKQLADWGLEYFDLFLIHFRKYCSFNSHEGRKEANSEFQRLPLSMWTLPSVTHQDGRWTARTTSDMLVYHFNRLGKL